MRNGAELLAATMQERASQLRSAAGPAAPAIPAGAGLSPSDQDDPRGWGKLQRDMGRLRAKNEFWQREQEAARRAPRGQGEVRELMRRAGRL